jgi:hypothetical protein
MFYYFILCYVIMLPARCGIDGGMEQSVEVDKVCYNIPACSPYVPVLPYKPYLPNLLVLPALFAWC